MAVYRSPGSVVYMGEDRVEIEVQDPSGVWRYGELRSWHQASDGNWSGMATWSSGPSQNRIDRFPAARIRPLVDGAIPGPLEAVDRQYLLHAHGSLLCQDTRGSAGLEWVGTSSLVDRPRLT